MNMITLADQLETGKTNIYFLKRFWSKQIMRRNGQLAVDALLEEWKMDTALMDALGLGIEQTIVFLFQQNPGFNAFEDWVLQINQGYISQERINRFNSLFTATPKTLEPLPPMDPVLSKEDWLFWEEHGYIIIPNAITPEQCTATESLIWEHMGMDKNDPSTWYQEHKDRQGIMLQLFQHPVLEANRHSPRIRKAYEELWGHTNLWVNTDRVGFNPPETSKWHFPGPHLHWDVSLSLPIPFGLQGILYVTDTEAEQGAFTLVPGFQHRIENWIHSLPPGLDPRYEDLHALGSTPLAGKAGDFIIWHHALPHGSRPNRTTKPRLVQYINWQPVEREVREGWR